MPRPDAAEIAEQNSRTTSLGLIGRAVEHYAAAVAVFDAIGDHEATWTTSGKIGPFAPDSASHLLAMSIEVALKAFLRQKGLDVYDIKQAYGHDLAKLLKRAQTEGLSGLPDANSEAVLRLLNAQFLRREFEFTVTGVRTFPTFDSLRDVACQVFHQVIDGVPLSRNFLSGKAGVYLLHDLRDRNLTP